MTRGSCGTLWKNQLNIKMAEKGDRGRLSTYNVARPALLQIDFDYASQTKKQHRGTQINERLWLRRIKCSASKVSNFGSLRGKTHESTPKDHHSPSETDYATSDSLQSTDCSRGEMCKRLRRVNSNNTVINEKSTHAH